MAEVNKTGKSTKRVFDIAKPSTTPANPTAKPVIVSHGPIMRDPTIVNPDSVAEAPTEQEHEPMAVSTHSVNIKPTAEFKKDEPAANQVQTDKSEESKPAETDNPKPDQSESITEPVETADSDSTEDQPKDAAADAKKLEEEQKLAAEQEAKINQLVESGKYFLPINMVEKRKNQRVVIIGVIVCLLLAAAWVDVALDAGLIRNGMHLPHTHFFSLKS